MSNLNIGGTILRLRKEKNITQEQLAAMVGVTSGAVSKWETGNSVPDITLLSPLARALNTSLDTLLSFQQKLSEAETADIKKELTDLFLKSGFAAGEEKCREYLKNYPNSIALKFTVAGLFQMYLMMSEDRSEDFLKKKMSEALDLFYQAAESRELRYAPAALFSIAGIEMMQENYEKSEKALKELPETTIDPLLLYPSLYMKQGKITEAMNLSCRMLLKNINQSYMELITMAQISKTQNDYNRAFFYLDGAYKLQNIFKIGLNSAAYNYSRLYIETGDMKNAAKWFKTYVDGLISSEYDYQDNLYFESIKLEVNQEGQKIIRKKLMQSLLEEEELKTLEGTLEYKEAIEELKAVIKKLS